MTKKVAREEDIKEGDNKRNNGIKIFQTEDVKDPFMLKISPRLGEKDGERSTQTFSVVGSGKTLWKICRKKKVRSFIKEGYLD